MLTSNEIETLIEPKENAVVKLEAWAYSFEMLENEKVIRDSSGDKQNFSLIESSTMILMLFKIEYVNAGM